MITFMLDIGVTEFVYAASLGMTGLKVSGFGAIVCCRPFNPAAFSRLIDLMNLWRPSGV